MNGGVIAYGQRAAELSESVIDPLMQKRLPPDLGQKCEREFFKRLKSCEEWWGAKGELPSEKHFYECVKEAEEEHRRCMEKVRGKSK